MTPSRLGAPGEGTSGTRPGSIPGPGSARHQPWSRCNALPRPPGCPRAGTALAASPLARHDGTGPAGPALCAPCPARPGPPRTGAAPAGPGGAGSAAPLPARLPRPSSPAPGTVSPAQLPRSRRGSPGTARLPRLPSARHGSPAPDPELTDGFLQHTWISFPCMALQKQPGLEKVMF